MILYRSSKSTSCCQECVGTCANRDSSSYHKVFQSWWSYLVIITPTPQITRHGFQLWSVAVLVFESLALFLCKIREFWWLWVSGVYLPLVTQISKKGLLNEWSYFCFKFINNIFENDWLTHVVFYMFMSCVGIFSPYVIVFWALVRMYFVVFKLL